MKKSQLLVSIQCYFLDAISLASKDRLLFFRRFSYQDDNFSIVWFKEIVDAGKETILQRAHTLLAD